MAQARRCDQGGEAVSSRIRLLLAVTVLASFLAGAIVQAYLNPVHKCWVCDDERACIIRWEDGTYSAKGRTINIGTLEPGESVTVTLDGQVTKTKKP